jgi:hypothetical protein
MAKSRGAVYVSSYEIRKFYRLSYGLAAGHGKPKNQRKSGLLKDRSSPVKSFIQTHALALYFWTQINLVVVPKQALGDGATIFYLLHFPVLQDQLNVITKTAAKGAGNNQCLHLFLL